MVLTYEGFVKDPKHVFTSLLTHLAVPFGDLDLTPTSSFSKISSQNKSENVLNLNNVLDWLNEWNSYVSPVLNLPSMLLDANSTEYVYNYKEVCVQLKKAGLL